MGCDCEKIEIEILKDFGAHKKGTKIKTTARDGIPMQQFWRDRLKDAEYDNCVKIVQKTTRKPSKIPQESDK